MSRGGRTRIWLGVVTVVLLLGAAWPSENAPPAGSHAIAPVVMETTETTPVEVRVRGHLFVIPLNYFRYPPRRDGSEDDGFLLRALLPDLEPYMSDNAPEFGRPGSGRKINILLHDGRTNRPLDELVEIYLEGTKPSAHTEATYGLAHGVARGTSRALGDIFVHTRDGEVDTLIVCNPALPDRAAACRHLFSWRVFDIDMHYAREMLPQWYSIQKNTEALLSKFLRSAPDDAGVAEHSARTTRIIVGVQRRRFSIPDNYFERLPPFDRLGDSRGFELELLLPALEPYTAHNAALFMRKGWGRRVSIALERLNKFNPLDRQLSFFLDGVVLAPARDETLGLPYAEGRGGNDVYAVVDDGRVETVIYCQSARDERDPGCGTAFTWQDFAIRLEYGREFLSEWRSLKQKTEELLDRLRQNDG